MKQPEGKYVALVKISEKGQIVIPKPVREMFNIKGGDTLALLADVERGVAITTIDLYDHFSQILNNQPEDAK